MSEYGRKASFYPYDDNGGTLVAIAGDDFAIVGSDTRLSQDFSIFTRNQSKLFPLTKGAILGCTGCWCDILTFTRNVRARLQIYEQEHRSVIAAPAISQMLSTMLYYKRFFPYYINNMVVGIDNANKGCIFSYDPIGHCERSSYRAKGCAEGYLQSLLDNQVGRKNMTIKDKGDLNVDRALTIVKDCFIAAAERDIYTGDSVIINIITKFGIGSDVYFLRQD